MSATARPHVLTFKADGAIAKGKAVKSGSDRDHVAVSAATTDKHIGIAQNDAVNAGDLVEVAMVGGGAKGLAQGTINAGAFLTSHTDGSLKKIAAANDRVIAMAMDSAVAGDILPVMVVSFQATATES